MKNLRALAVAVVIGLLSGLGIYFAFLKREPPKELPSLSPRSGDATLQSEFLNAKNAVDHYRTEIRTHPDITKNYVQLAQLLMQEARITAKHHEYIPKAQSLLDEALRRAPQDFEALATKAALLMTLHRFEEAKAFAEKATAQNAYNAGSYGVLCDAQVELGNYEDAIKTCDKMLSLRPDLRAYARAAYLRELHGDLQGATDLMRLAADAGISGQENRAWVLYQLGSLYFTQGKIDTAAFIYTGILEERPNFAYAESGLAMVKAAKKENGAATGYFIKAAQSAPEHVFLEQLADFYLALGQKQPAEELAKKVLTAFEEHEKDGWNIDREKAAFLLIHNLQPDESLMRAKRDCARRPKNIDALETYALALHKTGKSAQAAPLIAQAMRLGTKRATLHYHAATIYRAAGKSSEALAELRRATDERIDLYPLYAAGAKSLMDSLTQVAAVK